MKGFFKSLLASIIGCGIVLTLFFGVIFLVIVGLAAMESDEVYVTKENSVLYINLSGELVDRYEKNPLMELLGESDDKISLVATLSAIKKAKDESNIKGIYIRNGAVMGGSASFNEIRKAIADFKQTGKFVVAYGDVYTQNAYYLSSVADELFMNPEGMLDIHGYVSNPMFFKNLLDKLGIQMQIFKVGTYKSFVEPFVETKMSDANRTQMTYLLGGMWDTYKTDVAADRNIEASVLDEVANIGIPFSPAQSTVDYKLIDSLKYETEVHKYLKRLMNVDEKDKITLASVDNVNKIVSIKKAPKDVVAVVYAEGEITYGFGKSGITDGRYVKILEKLKDDENVKSVVFRVNSSGGSAFASEQIWKAVTDLKAVKPVVVSMGDYAASGGYYISANATKILAQPNTITGSIGIFGMFPNIEGLTNKIGLDFDVVKTNQFSDIGNITRPMRHDEKFLMQSYVERGYQLFLTRCADGRNMTKEEIDIIGQGRVWTGEQALKLGLVDEMGGLDDAIQLAAQLVSLDKYTTKAYPKQENFWESLFDTKKEELIQQTLKEYLGSSFKDFDMIRKMRNQDPIQARMPYTIE